MPGTRKQLATYRRKRNFRFTPEPSGTRRTRKTRTARTRGKPLSFVIHKHAATNLHFDLRLESDGVMKSWAVPKGPSPDPAQKRLAMQVEDHPIEYNQFEGTIPQGEYGGGTVMIWDRGTYTVDNADEYDGDQQAAVREGLRNGELKPNFQGERMKGSFVLVRTRGAGKPRWLLIKHRDRYARADSDIVARYKKSVVSDRTLEEIASSDAVWSRKENGQARKTAVLPMLATLAKDLPTSGAWAYEPKYDGVRVLAYATPAGGRLVTRNAKDKTKQFPEIAADLKKLSEKTGQSLVLDGEIVALVNGQPARFQELQGRTHIDDPLAIKRLAKRSPVALIVFDLLVDGDDVLLDEPWTVRRKRLEKLLARRRLPALRLGASSEDPATMLMDAQAHGWEGVMAKRMDAPYRPGRRSRDWIKLKIEQRQEFVVGGYTEPRKSRQYLGAILLGYYSNSDFVYAGHTGSGFTRKSLKQMSELLAPLERKTSPFTTRPKTNEKPHWVTPEVVVEVKFNEWTRAGKLRQPVFIGVREDKDARDVRREDAG